MPFLITNTTFVKRLTLGRAASLTGCYQFNEFFSRSVFTAEELCGFSVVQFGDFFMKEGVACLLVGGDEDGFLLLCAVDESVFF